MKCHYWLFATICCLINYSEQYGVQRKSVESESSETDEDVLLIPKWKNINKMKWNKNNPTQNDKNTCGYEVFRHYSINFPQNIFNKLFHSHVQKLIQIC